MIYLHVLMGLPGSGKSHFVKELQKAERPFIMKDPHIIDYDGGRRYWHNTPSVLDYVEWCAKQFQPHCAGQHIIIDAPIFTNEALCDVIETVSDIHGNVKAIVYHWNEDRETCLKNDGGRRDVPSTTTILHADYEEVNVQGVNEALVKAECDAEIIRVVPMTVQLKPAWERNLRFDTLNSDKRYFLHGDTLYSDEWCEGGTWVDYKGNVNSIAPDPKPEFKALNDFLATVPNITELHIEQIYQECVQRVDSDMNDFYGGASLYKKWVCDLRKLNDTLVALGYFAT